ncbi:MAG: M20/M25/M40 family metallo-hydrolase [Gemmatimonadales bacterium]|nr:M20/M25/M40 family metallo-hydrolase [Gemmatimonadales bacterium]
MRLFPALLLLAAPLSAQSGGIVPPGTLWEKGFRAWDAGRYIEATDALRSLLVPGVARSWIDSVAVLTGERYETVELTPDGGRPTWSADGQTIAYESGLPASRVTRVVRRSAPTKALLEVVGSGAALSPSGSLVAWVAPSTMNRVPLGIKEVATGRELPITGLGEWLPTGATFGSDDATLFVVVSRASDATRNDILRLTRTGDGFAVQGIVAPTAGFKGVPVAIPGGRFLVYPIPSGNPVRLPVGLAGLRAAVSFAIVDLQANTVRRIDGRAATISADGSMMAWVEGNLVVQGSVAMEENRLVAAPVAGGGAMTLYKGIRRIDAPALSPDGSRIAFQMMPVQDYELYTLDISPTASATPTRLTREIQHDVVPQWLNPTTVMAVMGEPRHRRSYLYDAETGARTRLFHNNTVRTIAPEYEWLPTPDGSAVLTVAERDGNTVSVERGLYLTELKRPVTREAVIARLDADRAGEVSLRDRGITSFAPIAAKVRAVTTQVDVGRVYGYEKALFDFDSKHISQPGNAKAIDYLLATYKSFGYDAQPQWFSPQGALAGKTANVLAVLKGTENPELVYVVSSHFDSRAEGPGADDNTSGTAALLEAARVMARHPQPATIVFASFTAEESGLLGSREYVRRAVADSVKLVGALNNDMLGWANDHHLDNTIRYSNPGIRDIQHAAAAQFSSMITYDALYYKSTDAAAYYEAYGDIVGGIGSYPVLGNPHYHMPHDILEVENHQLIAEASKTTVATLMLLASSPSRLKNLAVANGVATWTRSPEKGITGYLVTWGPADAPEKNRLRVTTPTARIPRLTAGMVVQVKAVNARGLMGWDWARFTVK